MKVKDNEGDFSRIISIPIPILTAPIIENPSSTPASIKPGALLDINLNIYDPDNRDNNGIIEALWDFNGDGLYSEIDDYGAAIPNIVYTYLELAEAGLKPGTNIIRIIAIDDDK